MFTTPHVSHVTCHVSHVRCHISRVMSHVTSHKLKKGFLTIWLTKLVEGVLSSGPTPPSLLTYWLNDNLFTFGPHCTYNGLKLLFTTDFKCLSQNKIGQQIFMKPSVWADFSLKSLQNTAYGRQSISWPMRIAAPIPNKILLVRQNLLKKKKNARRFYTLYEQKYLNLRPLLSISFPQGFRQSKKFGHWTLGSGVQKRFEWSEQRKKKSGIFLFLLPRQF